MSGAAGVRRYVDGKLVEGSHPEPVRPVMAQREIVQAKPADFVPVEKKPSIPAVASESITDTSDMRSFLLKQMVRAATGEIDTETVKNVVSLAQQVYNATKLELQAATILKDSERSIRALELVVPKENSDV